MNASDQEVTMGKNNYYGLYPALKKFRVSNKDEAIRGYIFYMLDRLAQMFTYKGLPDTIPQRELELLLLVNGFACITEVPDQGLYAFYGGLGGVPDAYYMPTECIIDNPFLKFNKIAKINKDCIIVRNDNMYRGVIPLCTRYAELLSESDITFRVTSINTRISSLLSANDDIAKASAEKYLKDIEEGKLGVIAGTMLTEGIKLQPGANTQTIYTEQIEYNNYLRACWFNELGLQANANMKRERLNIDEVQLSVKGILPLVENMLQERQNGLDAVNKMFGTNISVEFNGVWKDTEEEVQDIDQLSGDPEDPEKDPEKDPEGGDENDKE